MKTIYFSLLLVILASCSNDQTSSSEVDNKPIKEPELCDCNELGFDKDYNNFFWITPRNGYTGTCELYFPDGKIKLQKHFKGGKVHGKMTSYYQNGQIEDVKEFDTNFQVGEQKTYREDGILKYHALYERGNQTKILVYPGTIE